MPPAAIFWIAVSTESKEVELGMAKDQTAFLPCHLLSNLRAHPPKTRQLHF
jgi:hypothetical protein